MNVIASLASLVMLFLVLFGVILLGRKVANSRGLMSRSKAPWIFGAYIAVLLVSVIAMYVVPSAHLFGGPAADQPRAGESVSQKYALLNNAIQHDQLDNTPGISKLGHWSFNFSGHQLSTDGSFSAQVVIKNKAVNDGTIEVNYYVTQSFAGGIDYTALVKPPTIILRGDKMKIARAPSQDLKLIAFNQDFTVRQFLSTNKSLFYSGPLTSSGFSVLYLRVPKDVKVVDEAGIVQFSQQE